MPIASSSSTTPGGHKPSSTGNHLPFSPPMGRTWALDASWQNGSCEGEHIPRETSQALLCGLIPAQGRMRFAAELPPCTRIVAIHVHDPVPWKPQQESSARATSSARRQLHGVRSLSNRPDAAIGTVSNLCARQPARRTSLWARTPNEADMHTPARVPLRKAIEPSLHTNDLVIMRAACAHAPMDAHVSPRCSRRGTLFDHYATERRGFASEPLRLFRRSDVRPREKRTRHATIVHPTGRRARKGNATLTPQGAQSTSPRGATSAATCRRSSVDEDGVLEDTAVAVRCRHRHAGKAPQNCARGTAGVRRGPPNRRRSGGCAALRGCVCRGAVGATRRRLPMRSAAGGYGGSSSEDQRRAAAGAPRPPTLSPRVLRTLLLSPLARPRPPRFPKPRTESKNHKSAGGRGTHHGCTRAREDESGVIHQCPSCPQRLIRRRTPP